MCEGKCKHARCEYLGIRWVDQKWLCLDVGTELTYVEDCGIANGDWNEEDKDKPRPTPKLQGQEG